MGRWVLALLALVAVVAAAWLWLGPRSAAPAAPAPAIDRPDATAAALERIHAPAAREERLVDEHDAEPRAAVAADTAVESPAVQEAFATLAVRVVDARRTPQAGLTVHVGERRGEAEPPHGLTGADGRCLLQVPPWIPGDLRLVHVSSAEATTLFSAPCPLEPEVLVVLGERLVLRGRVATDPPLDLAEASVVLFALPTGAQQDAQFRARAPLDGEGRFEAETTSLQGEDVLRLQVSARRVHIGVAEVPLEELAAPEGALVVLPVCLLSLDVHDRQGMPLAGAQVRAEALDSDSGYAPYSAKTDAEGAALVVLPREPCEVGIALADFQAELLLFEEGLPAARRERVVLRPRAELPPIAGTVVDARGQPLEDAFVSLWLPGRSSASFFASHARVRTGPDGRFELAAPGAPVWIHAFHRDHGSSGDQLAHPPWGELELRIGSTAELRARLRASALDAENRSVRLEHLLLAADGTVADQGVGSGDPLHLRWLRPGDRELFVLLRGKPALGRARVALVAGEVAHCEVALRPGALLAGRVFDQHGRPVAGAAAACADPALPEAVRALWCRAASGADGRFQVFCSDPDGGPVEVRTAAGGTWTGMLRPGAEGVAFVR